MENNQSSVANDTRYRDPLDELWLSATARIGFAVIRAEKSYVEKGAARTISVAPSQDLDPDDCLAQLLFHELCHSLVAGVETFDTCDWGLDNTPDQQQRDVIAEHACLRVQAALLLPYGLFDVFAPTTSFRDYYDTLRSDPLVSRNSPESRAAISGLRRAELAPWAPHLQVALRATAHIAAQVAPFATNNSLWRRARSSQQEHPLGFLPGSAGDQHSCGDCTWHYFGGRGTAVDRCQQANGKRVHPRWPACNRWEEALDCHHCGACCRQGYDSVTISRRDPIRQTHPHLIVDRGNYLEVLRDGSACTALQYKLHNDDSEKTYQCTIYPNRPQPCRELEKSGPHCLSARQRTNLSI